MTQMRPATFGLDSPFEVMGLLAGAFLLATASVAAQATWLLIPAAAATLVAGALGVTSSLIRPARTAALLDGLELTGHETVVVVRCGRARTLAEVAGRLSDGRAVGLDTWSGTDRTGNTPRSAHHNLTSLGMSERSELVWSGADAPALRPGTADVVVFDPPWRWRSRTRDVPTEALRSLVRPGGSVVFIGASPGAIISGDTLQRSTRWWTCVPPSPVTVVRTATTNDISQRAPAGGRS